MEKAEVEAAVIAQLEPEARDAHAAKLQTLWGAAVLSKSISLKRIADAVAPRDGQNIGATLFYIEQRISEGVLR